MTDFATRFLTEADDPVLRMATLGNLNWCGERFTLRDVVDRREFAHYARLVSARGDFGFAAVEDGLTVGVVWVLFLPAEDAGYGFVRDDIPELSLWVHPKKRRRGMGRRLLRLAKAEAHRHGVAAVSLSVEHANVARHLYEADGFRTVSGRERDGVMVWVDDDPGRGG